MKQIDNITVHRMVWLSMVIVDIAESFNPYRQPYGLKMCHAFCAQITGCSSYNFLTSHLGCYLNIDGLYKNLKNGHPFNLDKNKMAGHSDVNDSCPLTSRVFKCKTKGQVCVTLIPMSAELRNELTPVPLSAISSRNQWKKRKVMKPSGQQKTGDRIVKATGHSLPKTSKVYPKHIPRILIFPYMKQTKHHVIQMYPLSNISSKYPHIEVASVTSLCYAPEAMLIFMSTADPLRVVSFVLDRPGLSTVVTGISVRGIAVDERNDKLFLISPKTRYITTVTLDGEEQTKTRVRHRLNEIYTIETEGSWGEKRLYLGTKRQLLSIDYDGSKMSNMQVLFNARGMVTAIFHSNRDNAVYFAAGREILIRYWMSREVTRLTTLEFDIKDLKMFEGELLLSSSQHHVGHIGTLHKSVYKILQVLEEQLDPIFLVV